MKLTFYLIMKEIYAIIQSENIIRMNNHRQSLDFKSNFISLLSLFQFPHLSWKIEIHRREGSEGGV